MTVRQLDAEALYRNLLESVRRSLAGDEATPLAIVGIRTGGVWIAERLHADLGTAAAQGVLTSAFHRDDHSTRGIPTTIGATRLDFPVADSRILLVDDILFTGRTIRAALEAMGTYGRPRAVQLAVMIDRGHRELPIRPDYVGKNLPTSHRERIQVQLVEIDEVDRVLLVPSPEEG